MRIGTRAVLLGTLLVIGIPYSGWADQYLGLQFGGGNVFFHSRDEFSSQTTCGIRSPIEEFRPYIEILGPDVVRIAIVGKKIIASDPAPMLKVDERPPFEITLGRGPLTMNVPKREAKAITSNIQDIKRLQVRWHELPNFGEVTSDIDLGNIITAYRVANTLCQWNSPRVPLPSPVKREMTRMSANKFRVLFGNHWGWQVLAERENGCLLIGGEQKALSFQAENVQPQSHVHEILVLDKNIAVLGKAFAKEFSLEEFLNLLQKAGDLGYVIFLPERRIVPLSGIFPAIEYARKDCHLEMTNMKR